MGKYFITLGNNYGKYFKGFGQMLSGTKQIKVLQTTAYESESKKYESEEAALEDIKIISNFAIKIPCRVDVTGNDDLFSKSFK